MMATWVELERLLQTRPVNWWDNLCVAIPELTRLAETPQPPEYHAEGDVAVHTRLAVEACPTDCDPDLLWAALLHDIGKPETTTTNAGGRITAHGHDKLGATRAEEILTRLEMPPPRRQRICWVIRHHMFHHAWQLSNDSTLTPRQRRYLADPAFPLLLELLRVDALASHSRTDGLAVHAFYEALLQDNTLKKG